MIHSTAIIDSKAKISENVHIGPYCVIGPNVEINENTKIQSHVNISGHTKIGKGNKIYPFVSINDPQDLKYNGEPTDLIIGDNNKIREYATINPGTVGGGGKTIIGNNCTWVYCDILSNFVIVSDN
jgi:UDP-N-acetylglucosamine acyltransferase